MEEKLQKYNNSGSGENGRVIELSLSVGDRMIPYHHPLPLTLRDVLLEELCGPSVRARRVPKNKVKKKKSSTK